MLVVCAATSVRAALPPSGWGECAPAAALSITATVGKGGDNRNLDVEAVAARLSSLGYYSDQVGARLGLL